MAGKNDWVPFSILLSRVLEPKGYVLKRIVGEYRYFYPPPGSSLPRIGFPVKHKMVSMEYVEEILRITEDNEGGDSSLEPD